MTPQMIGIADFYMQRAMFVIIKLCIPEIAIHHNDADAYIDGDGDDDGVTGCLFLRHPPTHRDHFFWGSSKKAVFRIYYGTQCRIWC